MTAKYPLDLRAHQNTKPITSGSRAAFLRRLSTAFAIAATTPLGIGAAEPNTNNASTTQWKGRKATKVKRWDVITIGNLSRNRYWGEGDEKGVRSAICTCTVVKGESFCLVVDPSLSKSEEMVRELDRRTGLRPQDVTAVFVTHEHGDHWFGLPHFPSARWLAAPEVALALNKTSKLPKPVEAVTGRLFDSLEIVPTPGHTMSHHSLRFDCEGLSVVIAGDAVPTLDFWRERRGYYNCVDFALSTKTMNKIAGLADIVVPGHDNYFLNRL